MFVEQIYLTCIQTGCKPEALDSNHIGQTMGFNAALSLTPLDQSGRPLTTTLNVDLGDVN